MSGVELVDRDLLSIQEVRLKIRAAKDAQAKLATFDQAGVDAICARMAKAGATDALRLAKMANEETGFGRVPDKVIKNQFGSAGVWDAIRDLKTVGVINEDPGKGLVEIGVPMGVIAGIIPSTNPTSTVFFKSLIAIKSGNAIVFSPHPSAKQCTLEATRLMAAAAEAAGCPRGAISCIENTTTQATNELMKHPDIALILATGGGAMVKAAYSSGNPAIGVGPGNGPAYIERTADIALAVKRILDSKTFDNGTICASEQSVVTEDPIRDQVIAEFKRQGGYFLNPDEKAKVGAILMRSSGTMNPAIVGKTPQYIAKLAGISVPDDARVLIGFETEVGDRVPYSKEKLCPVLGFYTQPDWESACELCIRILLHEGAGHTMTIHSQNEAVIREFALKKPVSRLLVNTPAALGGVGATTALLPSFTLGCGAVGGSSSSDNIGPLNLINIRRMARGVRELDQIRAESEVPSFAAEPVATTNADAEVGEDQLIALVLQRVLEKLK
ncbi:MAG: acetaldehyde dehydrogenase (acetylating) [Propionibacteriaceae bacterium]|jgi:acetaldehyde dehydrogenase (acetylating)|nr:acetaldehyde dehydrogenase (acetylating) [Propionibacteriaceae bacterium]